jgi:hypothetical protein
MHALNFASVDFENPVLRFLCAVTFAHMWLRVGPQAFQAAAELSVDVETDGIMAAEPRLDAFVGQTPELTLLFERALLAVVIMSPLHASWLSAAVHATVASSEHLLEHTDISSWVIKVYVDGVTNA